MSSDYSMRSFLEMMKSTEPSWLPFTMHLLEGFIVEAESLDFKN